LVFRA